MSIETWDVLLAIAGFVSFLFLYAKWEDTHFRKKGVKSAPAYFPLVGHMMGVVRRTEHFKDLTNRLYKCFPNERYIGVRQFLTPLVMVKDLELLKQIAIKDFDHFTDHMGTIEEDTDSLFGNILFSLKGQKWRDMRATLSPAFTGAKMRGMFDFVAECGQQMADFYLEQAKRPENKDKGLIEVEMKDSFTRYTNDVIATTAFGLQVNSLKDRNNQFYQMGKTATDFSGFQVLKMFAFVSAPKLMKFFRIPLFSEHTKNFFRLLVADTMKEREKNNIIRSDMIQLMMEAKKGVLKHEEASSEDAKEAGFATVEESAVGKETINRKWTDDEITAQVLLFFIAGFDTSATLLCFLAHELTLHQGVQRRLQEEVDELATANGGKLNYTDLQNMKYMDMVVSETLRYWPPFVATDRKCIKPYTLPPPSDDSENSLQLNPGDGLWVPIYAIHHDPQYFKDPETFNPERFSDDNKGDIRPFSFMPFGIGPRNCIGSRFALIEIKSVVFHLLHKFDFVKISRTQNPIQLKKDRVNMHPEKGFWIGLKPRR